MEGKDTLSLHLHPQGEGRGAGEEGAELEPEQVAFVKISCKDY